MNNRAYVILIFVLALTATAIGQSNRASGTKDYVRVEFSEGGATSELLPMHVAATSSLFGAEIGMKYFSVESDSDLSFILWLQGTRGRYSAGGTFGVKLYSDDLALSKNRLRIIDRIHKDGGKDALHFHMTTEELAWLATAKSIRIEIYNSDTQQRFDTISLTQTNMSQFKKFAKSVLMIRSFFS
jgi:hypothetical protein